ncbi:MULTISPECIES: putative PEP-binding protein [Vibrio]|uniref:putative PEP-binding protein n=1 Tax=Vibrio TaxID=662 RepID=UPI000C162998|nr:MULTISPECIES: putative PEP-binding protein [Vibrio]NNN45178.1 phosphoenolpyruvate synthase [Vibrio sp. 1-1(7)]NNN72551.1 phosphoenolpyruvate synthase [Vibrio sp. 12-2(3-a)]
MSLQQPLAIVPKLAQGNTLPQTSPQTASDDLFVSLSELIADSVFYHPAVSFEDASVTELEKNSLSALLDGKTIEAHFVATLVSRIEEGIRPFHKVIRICFSGVDSAQFKTLIGGEREPVEMNPAMGVRGVSRFASEAYAKAFNLECQVIKELRDKGYHIEIVVPFVRALSDAATIIDRLAEQGLPRGLNGLKVLYACHVPAAAILAERLLQYFDGMVIDWQDLTQFTLAVDKDNRELDYLYNPDSEAIMLLAETAIKAAQQAKKPLLVVTHALQAYPKLQNFLAENVHAESIYNF